MSNYIDSAELDVKGPLSICLDMAGDMLAATKQWELLCDVPPLPTGEEWLDLGSPRSRIFVAEIPRANRRGDSPEVHAPDHMAARLPYAIVHLDDEGVAATFSYIATRNQFASSQSVVLRLYLSPPANIDPKDINLVERWVLNTVGRIIRGEDSETSPGLLDLSHRGGMLMIRQLDVLGPAYPDLDQRQTDEGLYVAVELILQIGFGG